MAGIETGMEDFFASKSTMNFLDIPTMSLGLPEKPDDTYEEIVEDTGAVSYTHLDVYKRQPLHRGQRTGRLGGVREWMSIQRS